MKGYLIFILLIMGSFTGYILVKRPGTLNVSGSGLLNSISQSLGGLSEVTGQQAAPAGPPPHFSYLNGDVLVNTAEQSFLAQNNLTLRLNDEIFISTNSSAVLKIGENKYLHFSEGTQALLKGMPQRQKGFTTVTLLNGTVLVDFFKTKEAVGIRIDLDRGHVLSPDGTFRVSKKTNQPPRVAVDRGMVMVTNSVTSAEAALNPGEGVELTDNSFVVDTYPWVDQYPWEKNIKETLLIGNGRKATFKAPLLSTRDSVQKRERVADQAPRRLRAGSVNYRKSVETEPVKKSESNSFVKNLGNTATNALKNLPSVGGKIQESTETVQNFEQIQKDRVKALDRLDD